MADSIENVLEEFEENKKVRKIVRKGYKKYIYSNKEFQILALFLLAVFIVTSINQRMPLISNSTLSFGRKLAFDTNKGVTGFAVRLLGPTFYSNNLHNTKFKNTGQNGVIQQGRSIVILNPQSYPHVLGNWSVHFITRQTNVNNSTLSIHAVNGTFFEYDVKPIRILCNDNNYEVPVHYAGAHLYYTNWTCKNATLTMLVLSSGKHNLRFEFNNEYAYAHNYACNASTEPVINDGDQVAYEGKPYTEYMNVTDPNGLEIIYYDIYVSAEDSFTISINNETGLINFTPVDSDFGNHEVEYKAKNNESCVGSKAINFYIYDEPNITSTSPAENVSFNEDTTNLFNVSVLNRNENDTLNYFWYYDGIFLANESGVNKSEANVTFGYCSAGNHNITVVVNNSYNLSTSFSWNISVLNVDRAPVFNKTILNFTWTEGSNLTNAFNLSDYFFDYDTIECGDENLTFNFSQPDGSMPENITVIINSQSPHNVSFYSDKYWFGNRTIIFYAYDSHGLFNTSNEVFLNVSFVNHPPSIGYNNKSVYKGEVLSFQINATDPDLPYDSLNFSYILLDNFPEFNMSNSGLVNFKAETAGNHSVNISVKDSHGAGDYKIVNFEIKNNSIPYFNELVPDVSKLSNETYTYQVNASDDDNETITYDVSSNNTFPSLSIDSSTGLMNFALTKCDVGYHTVTITISDPHNATNQTSFDFNVTNVPSAPLIQNFSPKHARTNFSFNVLIRADDNDFPCPGDNLNFTINSTYSNKFSITNLNNTGNFMANFTALSNETGNYSLEITVNDLYGLSDTFDFVFEFTNNHPPVINEDNITANATQPFIYQVNATDYDNDALVFNYSTNLSDFYMTKTGLINFTPLESDEGTYNLYVNVSDGINTTEKNLTFNVIIPNLPPKLFIHNLNATANKLFSYQVNASDPNNDSLTFNYSFIGNTLASFYMNSTGLINFTPSYDDIGNYVLNISVTDSHYINSTLINFTVYWQNHAPEIISAEPDNMTINESTSLIFNISVRDIDLSYGDNISVNWTVDGKEYLSTDYNYNYTDNTTWQSFNYTFDYCSAGLHNVKAEVSDNLGNTTSEKWLINVNNVDRAPYFGIKRYYNSTNMDNLTSDLINFSEDNIKINTIDGTTYYQKGTFTFMIDFIAENTNYDEIQYDSIILNSSEPVDTNISVETRSSADNITWSSWKLVNNNRISSESQRYLELRINLSTNNTLITPIIHNLTVNYKIANISFPENTNPWWVNLDNFFYDDDINCGDDYINYSYSNNSIVTVNIVNSRVQLQPLHSGTDKVVFKAVDSHNELVYSNEVLINVEKVSEIQPRVIYSTSTSTSIQPMPIMNIVTLNILNLLNSTLYENNTIRVPVEIYNPGNTTLFGIKLTAESEENLSMHFGIDKIDSLKPNETVKTELVADSYKSYPNYEILVKARVTNPNFEDSAKIMINSIELGSESDKEFNTKVTFTRDLLKENPECLELNEFLDKARTLIQKKEYDKADALLNSIVRTCKYLVTSKQGVEEKPSPVKNHNFTILITLVVTGLISLISIVLYLQKHFH